MLALGPINPNTAAEINSLNATTLSSVSAFARVSFRSMTPLSFLIQRESCNGLIHKPACCSYGWHRTRHDRLCTERKGGPRPYTVLRSRERAGTQADRGPCASRSAGLRRGADPIPGGE